jgi:Leucine-rich repeat (LRR) protein
MSKNDQLLTLAKIKECWQKKLPKLELDLSIFGGVLPAEVGLLTHLKSLTINEAKVLPRDIMMRLTALEELRVLYNRGLREYHLPPSLINLELVHCNLKDFSLQDPLPRLQKLDLAGNKISELTPDLIMGLKELRYLGIESNRMKTLPEEIGELSKLEHLSASNLPLRELPQSFPKLKALKYLFLMDCKLSSLPPGFEQLSNLVEFHIPGNDFTEVPECLSHMPNLESLNMWENLLRHIPESHPVERVSFSARQK